ncbi:MAG: DMT family transporter [Bacteroidota bacterium]
MLFIVLSIVTTTLIITLFKLFGYFKVNTFLAIIVNYLTAAIFGFLISPSIPSIEIITEQSWLPVTLLAGILFIAVFQAMALTTQKIGVSVATVASKMSVVIPVIAAFILYGDSVNGLKIIGLIIAVVSVVLTSIKEESTKSTSSFIQKIGLPSIVFFGGGSIDLFVNYMQINFTSPIFTNQLLLSFTFTGAFLTGLVLLLISVLQKKKIDFNLKSIGFGIFLGVLNFYSIIFIMKAIESNVLQSSVLFPLNNMSVVLLSSSVGYFFFKEKISFINLLGIILAVIAILLIMIS